MQDSLLIDDKIGWRNSPTALAIINFSCFKEGTHHGLTNGLMSAIETLPYY